METNVSNLVAADVNGIEKITNINQFWLKVHERILTCHIKGRKGVIEITSVWVTKRQEKYRARYEKLLHIPNKTGDQSFLTSIENKV